MTKYCGPTIANECTLIVHYLYSPKTNYHHIDKADQQMVLAHIMPGMQLECPYIGSWMEPWRIFFLEGHEKGHFVGLLLLHSCNFCCPTFPSLFCSDYNVAVSPNDRLTLSGFIFSFHSTLDDCNISSPPNAPLPLRNWISCSGTINPHKFFFSGLFLRL